MSIKGHLSPAELFQRFLENQLTAGELEQMINHFSTAEEQELKKIISQELYTEPGTPVTDEPKRLSAIHQSICQKILLGNKQGG